MRPIMTWTLTVVAAAMFLFAGGLKLSGAPIPVQMFSEIGVGQWLRYVTGLLEVGGAIALFVPSVARFAALTLATVMTGAIATHVFIIGGNPLPAAALLAITTAIAYLRTQQFSSRAALA